MTKYVCDEKQSKEFWEKYAQHLWIAYSKPMPNVFGRRMDEASFREVCERIMNDTKKMAVDIAINSLNEATNAAIASFR